MKRSWTWPLALLLWGTSAVGMAAAAPADGRGIEKIRAAVGGRGVVEINPATGTPRFVRVSPGSEQVSLAPASARGGSQAEQALAFVRDNAAAYGLKNPAAELQLARTQADPIGGSHLSFQQVYEGYPVFGAVLRAHFDESGLLHTVNGTLVPDVTVAKTPLVSASAASQAAAAVVELDVENGQKLNGATARNQRLVVFRTGLVQGIPGENYLAYEVEISNGGDVREFVYLDAISGKKLDQITGIHEARDRRAFDGEFNANDPGPNYPASPFWLEGDAFPTGTQEADNMIESSAEVYAYFANSWGRDSFDGAGATLDAIFNRGWSCPNASWNGIYISFCNGLTTDDVTGHEWAHAYTEYTDGLIYQWQPGALNESYSDIWGETIDLINGRGLDAPAPVRADTLDCTPYQRYAPVTHVNAPVGLAGQEYPSGTSSFSPAILSATTADLIRPDDGEPALGTVTDGCCFTSDVTNGTCAPGSWVNAASVAGKIVLVDRGACGFAVKALNAQRMGAVGVVIANVAASGSPTVPPNMGGTSPAEAVTVPTVSMNLANGDILRTALTTDTVNVSLEPNPPAVLEDSVRWLMGEESTAAGLELALRDMWAPNCAGNPGRVQDPIYWCSTGDAGGVHINSGVPNKMFALLVDGGTYNAQTVSPIGLTKAAHIYWRAQSVYQVPVTDFVDHADAMEASCQDLVGINLLNLSTSPNDISFSGQFITAADCAEVTDAIAAVQLRIRPTQCNFVPRLNKSTPAACPVGAATSNFSDDFEGDVSAWTLSHDVATVIPRDWLVVDEVPVGTNTEQGTTIADKAFFATNELDLNNCLQDATGLLYLESPSIVIGPGFAPRISFEHYIAVEAGWDGGNVKLSVNGGPYQLLTAGTAAGPNRWIFNGHSHFFVGPAAGSTNPLGANCNSTADPLCQTGWSGTDGGSVEGSWGTSIGNLSGLVVAGDTIKLRFDFGSDFCTGRDGWYVDDVKVYQCNAGFGTASLSINDVTVTEGDAGTANASFTVTLSEAVAQNVTVAYATADGTATQPGDYTTTAGTLTFTPGQLTKTVNVPVVGDLVGETPQETFTVVLSGATNASISDDTGVGTINDNDYGIGSATLSIADASILEPDSGTANLDFTVTLSEPVAAEVTVDFEVTDGTATAGNDYFGLAGTLTFAQDETTKTITVTVIGDLVPEQTETLLVTLSNASGATIATGEETATGTITDDDFTKGDLSNDGKADLLWWNSGTGNLAIWKMDGATRTAGMATTPAGYAPAGGNRVVGVADFNADGNNDIVWYNTISGNLAVWFMDGNGVRTSGSATTPAGYAPATGWVAVGTGDFNGDGDADILWRNSTSGALVIWFMDGVTRTSGVATTPAGYAPATNWVFAVTGDFNDDDKADIVWRNSSTGAIVIWLMDGANRTSGVTPTPGALSNVWEIVAAGDFDGDDETDIAWRNTGTGAVVIWFMDGTTRTSSAATTPAGYAPGTGWTVVGPR